MGLEVQDKGATDEFRCSLPQTTEHFDSSQSQRIDDLSIVLAASWNPIN